MKKIDLIIIGYAAMIVSYFIFLTILQRFDVISISGPIGLIPLIITLIQRRKE